MKMFLSIFGLVAITAGTTIQFGPIALVVTGVFALFEAYRIK